MIISRKLLQNIKVTYARRAFYFSHFKQENAKSNLKFLKQLSVLTFFIVIFLNIITPYLLPNWKLTTSYMTMPFFTIPFFFLAKVLEKIQTKKYVSKIINASCLLFFAILSSYLIYISSIHYYAKNMPQVYISLVFIVLPVIFIVPQILITLFTIIFSVIFLFLSYKIKPHSIFVLDCFDIVASIFISQCSAFFVWNLRLSENRMRKRLEHLCRMDTLTGILNKGTFEDECNIYLKSRPENEHFIFFVVDLDNFKAINDSFGHLIGDKLLNTFGHNLSRIFRAGDLVGRVGGDEFAILLKRIGNTDIVARKAEEIQKAIKAVLPENYGIQTSCSIGVTLHTKGPITFTEVFNKSDSALYQAKHAGKKTWVLYKD